MVLHLVHGLYYFFSGLPENESVENEAKYTYHGNCKGSFSWNY